MDLFDHFHSKPREKIEKENRTIEDNYQDIKLVAQKKFMQSVQEQVRDRFGKLPESGFGALYCEPTLLKGSYDGAISQFKEGIFCLESTAHNITWGLLNYLDYNPDLTRNTTHIKVLYRGLQNPPVNWEEQIAAENIAEQCVRGYVLVGTDSSSNKEDKFFGVLTTKSFEHIYDEINTGLKEKDNTPELKRMKLEEAITQLFNWWQLSKER